MGISLKLRGRVFNFSKVNISLSFNNCSNIVSKESNNVKSFIMFLEGFNEEEVGITSSFSEGFSFSINIGSSLVNPSEVFLGLGNF